MKGGLNTSSGAFFVLSARGGLDGRDIDSLSRLENVKLQWLAGMPIETAHRWAKTYGASCRSKLGALKQGTSIYRKESRLLFFTAVRHRSWPGRRGTSG